MTDGELIDKLGGTLSVSRLCCISTAAVSQWRHNGIPKARMMFFRLYRPDLFKKESSMKG
jgi:hypothetical protein